MPTISMSALWVKISTILCLCYTAEMNEVVWKEVGKFITIQCKSSSDHHYLTLQRGLNEEHVFGIDKATKKEIICEGMKGRIQTHGEFPNVDILIKNLRSNDTGPYWCVYSKIETNYNNQITKGNGSLLLVVTGDSQATSTKPEAQCKKTDLDMLPVYIIVAVAALLIIILSFIMWIMQKNKSSDNRMKLTRVANGNDVYEDMRGTLRR